MEQEFIIDKLSSKTAMLFSESIDGMLLNTRGEIVALSHLCAAAVGCSNPEELKGRRISDVLDDYALTHCPNSPIAKNGGALFLADLKLAKEFGIYTAVSWMVSPTGLLSRMLSHYRVKSGGFVVQLVPIDDDTVSRWIRYDVFSGELMAERGLKWTWDDLRIMDRMMAGHSLRAIAEETGMSLGRIRSRIRRACESNDVANQTELTGLLWETAGAGTVPSRASMWHAYAEIYRKSE